MTGLRGELQADPTKNAIPPIRGPPGKGAVPTHDSIRRQTALTYPDYLPRYIAPSYFVGVKMNWPEGLDVVTEMFEWHTLDEGGVLPAFTTRERCREFFKAYYAGADPTPPKPLNLDAIALAEVVEDLGVKGLKNVVFDPQAIAPGSWGRPSQVLTAGYCRRFAREMRPGLEKLFAEKAAELE